MVRKAVNATQTSDEEKPVAEVIPQYRREQLAENVPTQRIMSSSELRNIDSFEDAATLLQMAFGYDILEAREELGDGFDFIENKDVLVGRPLLFLQWKLRRSTSYTDRDNEPLQAVEAWVLAKVADGARKVRIADFSTGICQQLWEYTERTGRSHGLSAPKGLRKSEFSYTSDDGRQSVATTYYIDLSKDL